MTLLIAFMLLGAHFIRAPACFANATTTTAYVVDQVSSKIVA
jgi:hypothetical protein